jgi:hypothetical protein
MQEKQQLGMQYKILKIHTHNFKALLLVLDYFLAMKLENN